MAARLLWTEQARDDLLDIYLLIGAEQPLAAERFFDRISNVISALADHPKIGSRRNDIAPGVRLIVEHPYLLIYRLEPDARVQPVQQVEIVRIIDGRRDLRTLF